jgi:uncharacterized protein YdaT
MVCSESSWAYQDESAIPVTRSQANAWRRGSHGSEDLLRNAYVSSKNRSKEEADDAVRRQSVLG